MPENLELSRGAKRCLALLQSYAARSGIAFPFQKTLAAKLEVDVRTVKRYIRELRAAGALDVTRRGRTSAQYEIQKGQNVPSSVPSNVPSSARFLNELKLSTVERVWPKPMGTATQNSPEMERVFEWAKEHGQEVKTGADLFRVMEAMDAA